MDFHSLGFSCFHVFLLYFLYHFSFVFRVVFFFFVDFHCFHLMGIVCSYFCINWLDGNCVPVINFIGCCQYWSNANYFLSGDRRSCWCWWKILKITRHFQVIVYGFNTGHQTICILVCHSVHQRWGFHTIITAEFAYLCESR